MNDTIGDSVEKNGTVVCSRCYRTIRRDVAKVVDSAKGGRPAFACGGTMARSCVPRQKNVPSPSTPSTVEGR